jgi:hypothetical protein
MGVNGGLMAGEQIGTGTDSEANWIIRVHGKNGISTFAYRLYDTEKAERLRRVIGETIKAYS